MNGAENNTLLRCTDVALDVQDGRETRRITRNLSLEVPPGNIAPLIGPSGSGKSTLLRAVVRLHPLAEGKIAVEGTPIESYPPPQLRLTAGLLHQRPVFSPGTLRHCLLEPFTFHNVKTPSPTLDELLEELDKLGLDGSMLDRQVDTLSGGEAQRAGLARLLLVRPKLLLLDEPTANLDVESGRRIVQRVKRWIGEEQGRGALWVAHEPSIIRQLDGTPLRMTKAGIHTIHKKTGVGQ